MYTTIVAWRDTQSYEDADRAPWENVKIAQFHFVLLLKLRAKMFSLLVYLSFDSDNLIQDLIYNASS